MLRPQPMLTDYPTTIGAVRDCSHRFSLLNQSLLTSHKKRERLHLPSKRRRPLIARLVSPNHQTNLFRTVGRQKGRKFYSKENYSTFVSPFLCWLRPVQMFEFNRTVTE